MTAWQFLSKRAKDKKDIFYPVNTLLFVWISLAVAYFFTGIIWLESANDEGAGWLALFFVSFLIIGMVIFLLANLIIFCLPNKWLVAPAAKVFFALLALIVLWLESYVFTLTVYICQLLILIAFIAFYFFYKRKKPWIERLCSHIGKWSYLPVVIIPALIALGIFAFGKSPEGSTLQDVISGGLNILSWLSVAAFPFVLLLALYRTFRKNRK